MTNKPLHQAVIAPSMMYLLYQLDGDVAGYPRKQFEEDIVNECEKDIRSCFAAGAAHVVMDFTEGRLAPRNDPRNPWTTRNLLPFIVELDNRVLDRFSAGERKNIGVHVCPGGDVELRSQRRRALRGTTEAPVQAQCRLFPVANGQRTRPRGRLQIGG